MFLAPLGIDLIRSKSALRLVSGNKDVHLTGSHAVRINCSEITYACHHCFFW